MTACASVLARVKGCLRIAAAIHQTGKGRCQKIAATCHIPRIPARRLPACIAAGLDQKIACAVRAIDNAGGDHRLQPEPVNQAVCGMDGCGRIFHRAA